jgi:hypothetical protein
MNMPIPTEKRIYFAYDSHTDPIHIGKTTGEKGSDKEPKDQKQTNN